MISLIAALSLNRVIGKDNQLPWHLPADLKHFKSTTLGKPVVMGRNTYDSIGKPLPGRLNIVVTQQPGLVIPGCTVVHSLAEAVIAAQAAPELMIIGGATLYKAALPIAQRMYLTWVKQEFEGDTYFPAWNTSEWQEVAREEFTRDANNPHDYSFVILEHR